MQIFLMWHKGQAAQRPDARAVADKLHQIYAPLFTVPPETRIIETESMALVGLWKPINGFIPPHFEESAPRWALAVEYPATARHVLESASVKPPEGRVLLTLTERLESEPEPILRELAPMFTVAWASADGATWLQNDGLGLAQLYETECGGGWAVSNKLTAFPALGIPLEPAPEEWAVRMTMDWFPLELTGYRGIRFAAPGTQWRISREGVTRQSFDVLADWLAPRGLTPDACLELAHAGFQDHLRATAPLWDRAVCGLTGGRDSRAVASGLLKEGLAEGVTFSVRGGPKAIDVELARRLADLAGIPLRVRKGGGPERTASDTRQAIAQALLWQAGYIDIRQHATFMLGSPELGGGDVNLMGQHGEIGRGYFAERVGAARLTPPQMDAALERFLVFNNTGGHFLLRRDRLDFVRETVRRAIRQADRYGLHGLDRLDFFYLFERTRRWASAGNHIQPGQILTPFLTPSFIRAVYNYPAAERGRQPFHDFIVARNLPAWSAVKYEKDVKVERQRKEARRERHHYLKRARHAWHEARLRWFPATVTLAPTGFWAGAGRELATEALAGEGFWREIFDPRRARRLWPQAPDQLIVAALLPLILAGGPADAGKSFPVPTK